MAVQLIKIDRSTVRPNPRAGQNVHYVAGRLTEEARWMDPDGTVHVSMSIPTQELYTLGGPEGKYLFEYEPTVLVCDSCGNGFGHGDLECDEMCFGDLDSSDYDEMYSDSVCPFCHAWNCCEYRRETLQEVLCELSTAPSC